MYIGSFYKGKGIDLIYDLAKYCPKIQFHIYGDRKFLPKNLDLTQVKNMKLFNYINYSKIPSLLNKYEVALMPLQKKNFGRGNIDISDTTSPMKMFDYLASGKILLASKLNVYNHILINGYNCFLIDPENLMKWKNQIYKVFNNLPKIKKLKLNAKKTAAKYLEESSLSIVYRHGEDDWEKHLLIHPASKEINHPDNSEYENYDPHLVEIIIDYFPTMYCNVHRRFQNLQCYSCDERGCCEFIKCGIDGCNTYMCSDKECLKQCKTCEVPYCADHIIEECHLCYGQLCRDDVETCNECNRPYCASHKSDCAICDQTFCDECFELCSDCNLRYCSDCSFECSNCQNSSCSACAERSKTLICPICENLSCEDCIEDCQECEREICHGCMSDGGICDNCYG